MMLMIIMHNNQLYLNCLLKLAEKENITNATIASNKNIGSRIIGATANLIYSRGKVLNTYDKAFIATVDGRDTAEKFIDSIKEDTLLEKLNIDNKGFICCVPTNHIDNVEKTKGGAKMQISSFLEKDKIKLGISSKDKEAAIKELALLLKDSNQINDYDQFLNDVFQRESLNTTGIGNYIALPHARTDSVNDLVIACGVSPEGIEFNSLDGKPAKFIFLLGTPLKRGLDNYLQLLAYLTRVLNKQEFQTQLLKATAAQDIIKAFEELAL